MELFRRNRINGQDVSPVTSRPGEFTPPTQDLSPFSIEATEDLGRKENKFIKGINSIVAKDEDAFRNIPQADLERLAILASAIPRTESEYGKGVTYKMESLARGPAKVYRRIKQGTPMSRTLSVGMSQINPQMLSDRIRDKYFKGMSDTKIERKLARDEKLSGQITLEHLVDNYNLYRDDPILYGGNDDYFWYALAKSHQSPMFFKDAKRKELLKSENVDYSNAVFAELNKFRTKPEFKSGGKLSEKIGTLVNEGYPQKQAAAIAYDMKRKGKLVDGGTLQPIGQNAVKVSADNPAAPDSVELNEAYVDHGEIIARLKDIGKYVFPTDTINPITGNTFAKDAERITKANAAAEKRPYDKEAQTAFQ